MEIHTERGNLYFFGGEGFFFFFRRRDVMNLGMKLFQKHRSLQNKTRAFFPHSLSNFFPDSHQRQILGQTSEFL